ncbi:MAG: hypothetical protein UY64_C0022G0001 [Parcubacteria group bacterium GW2011_GWA1_51_12]|nr:MAG: hypothetical protein UY64_C0022G0001 [Parcubacteria group bacterium GW2011_GWA1_51_12]
MTPSTSSRFRSGFTPLQPARTTLRSVEENRIQKTHWMPRRLGRVVTGFTLIELIVVIAIIGLLSSIVLTSLTRARQKARDARRVADIRQIRNALELFATSNNGEYADTIAVLASDKFMPVEPKDPSTAASYPYDNYTDSTRGACVVASGTCLFYHLGAKLEQGAAAGALLADRDLDAVAGAGPDGLSVAAACGADATATAGTDLCYDVTP